MRANVIVFEAAVLILTPVFYLGARRAMGRSRNRAFLLGAVLFSLAIETTAVIGGLKNYYWYAQNDYFSHYPLGGYIIWLGLVPLAAVLLWYMVSATSYLAARLLVRKESIWRRSAVAGLIAVVFYLLIEPVAVSNHWWTWNLESFYLIDVPVLTWIITFFAVFLFTAIYRLTIIDRKDPRVLKGLENNTLRRLPLKMKDATTDLPWDKLLIIYCFRLVMAFLVLVLVTAPFMILFWVIANRGHIIPGW